MADARRMSASGGSYGSAQDREFEESDICIVCARKFHAFRRKHRCRSCGQAVCGSCARTHKSAPARSNGDVSRVCDHCIHEERRQQDIERARARQLAVMEEEQRMTAAETMRREQLQAEKRAREEAAKRMRLRDMEQRHFGPSRGRPGLARCRSLDDCSHAPSHEMQEREQTDELAEAMKRSQQIVTFVKHDFDGEPQLVEEAFVDMSINDATLAPLVEECAICLEELTQGNAIYTTACGHTFHWQCLKQTEQSNLANYGKCPSCRADMPEMKVKRECDHPRVRAGHRFCRDCGDPVTERDAKPRSIQSQQPPLPQRQNGSGLPPANSYRAGLHGALVRCPQCQMQMRVLPHMYNMRVRCTRGHIFFVQVAGQQPSNGWNRRPSNPAPMNAPVMNRLGNAPGAYPPRGIFQYRPTANTSQM